MSYNVFMEDLSLHILDIAQNALRAGGETVTITLVEDEGSGTLTLSIRDDGKGMDKETLKNVRDPFFTTKEGKDVGLGLAFLIQAAEETGGEVDIRSEEGRGTEVKALFHTDHPDMKPVGDVFGTMAVLVCGSPATRFIFDYKKGDESHHFDSLAPSEQ